MMDIYSVVGWIVTWSAITISCFLVALAVWFLIIDPILNRSELQSRQAQVEYVRHLIAEDSRWLAHDPVARAICQRHLAMLADEWEPQIIRDIAAFRDDIGLSPHILDEFGLDPHRPVRDFDLITHLHRQRDFSLRTFGPGPRTQGVLDHIRKELSEIEADPTDIEEWADLLLLALDGAWRAGHEPEVIAATIEAKQRKNENRTWPDWRTADLDKAIEHIRDEREEHTQA